MREGGALSLRRLRIKETDPHEWHFRNFRPLVSSNPVRPIHAEAWWRQSFGSPSCVCPKIIFFNGKVVGLVQVNRTSSPCPAPQEGCTP